MNLKLHVTFTFFVVLFTSILGYGQNHRENLRTINTLEEAKSYASSFEEVFTGTVNLEKDVFFFDEIDTSKMSSYVGTSISSFGKTTKLLQDSVFNIVNIQLIRLDFDKMPEETADILMGQMLKLLNKGSSYWDLKKRFSHTSAHFSSAPEIVEEISAEYGVLEDQMTEGAFYEWEKSGKSKGIIIVEKLPHFVPGFTTISFLNLNNGKVR
jgi:hypothetical protein